MSGIVVAVGAHPDDYELGCAGTLQKYMKNGFKAYGIVITKGERGGHCPEGSEVVNSANYLGLAGLIQFDYEDTAVKFDGKTIDRIEKTLKELSPDIVFTHTPHDRHQDHRNTALSTMSAARRIDNIFMFETPSTTYDFFPHFFVDIDETLDSKIESLRNYHTQIQKGIVDIEDVIGKARYHGHKNHLKYAEAFEVNHMIQFKGGL